MKTCKFPAFSAYDEASFSRFIIMSPFFGGLFFLPVLAMSLNVRRIDRNTKQKGAMVMSMVNKAVAFNLNDPEQRADLEHLMKVAKGNISGYLKKLVHEDRIKRTAAVGRPLRFKVE